MKLTAQEEYGLRCVLQVARAAPTDSITIAEIAERESLTFAYVAKLMRLLREAGLVNSIRGKSGGYRLAKPAAELRVSQVIDGLGEHLYDGCKCGRYVGQSDECVHTDDCAIRALWSGADRLLFAFLASWTLADLIRPERSMARRIKRQIRAQYQDQDGTTGKV